MASMEEEARRLAQDRQDREAQRDRRANDDARAVLKKVDEWAREFAQAALAANLKTVRVKKSFKRGWVIGLNSGNRETYRIIRLTIMVFPDGTWSNLELKLQGVSSWNQHTKKSPYDELYSSFKVASPYNLEEECEAARQQFVKALSA